MCVSRTRSQICASLLHEVARESGDVLVTASNRYGMVYRLQECRLDARGLAGRLEGRDGVDLVLFREDGKAVARRAGEEIRFAPAAGAWQTEGDLGLLDPTRYPDGLGRAWRALACPAAGRCWSPRRRASSSPISG